MASPSQPMNIRSPKSTPLDQDVAPSPYRNRNLQGTPDIHAIRAQYQGTSALPNIPLRPGSFVPSSFADSSNRPVADIGSGISGGTTPNAGGDPAIGLSPTIPAESSTPFPELDDLPAEEKARVLAWHLVPSNSRQRGSGNRDTQSLANSTHEQGDARSEGHSSASSSVRPPGPRVASDAAFPITYDSHGADITHDIYKWHADQKGGKRTRALSFSGMNRPQHPVFQHIHEPGGFRRNYVKLRANVQGTEEPRMLNNFIDFLLLFGHFAGEDLEEEDDEDGIYDEEVGAPGTRQELGTDELAENTPLLSGQRGASPSRSRSRRRKHSVSSRGNATVTQAVLMLLKSFVGTGVLFLGKAFYNGGLLFSSILFVFIACISLYSFLLLVKTKFVVSGSFGEIGGTLYGPWMHYLILGSIVVSQMGFVAAYTIFVAENLQAFVMGVTNCLKLIPVQYFILVQLVVLLPLVLIRDLARLSSTALLADVFILSGLVYIFSSEISIIGERGIAHVEMFNPTDFSLFVGTAVFSFEGIGLVIPITDAMREPHKFPMALTGVMAFLLLLFGGAGALAYSTFGSEVQTNILVNLDTKSGMVQVVQLLYALAILLSVPLQLFPAVRILEHGLFTRSGKGDIRVKWTKNMFRFTMVLMCTVISWAGAADLDKFVSFVGCFACVPLCYVYPAMLHYKACARTRKEKMADIVLIVFGLVTAAYTTTQCVKLMLQPASAGPSIGT